MEKIYRKTEITDAYVVLKNEKGIIIKMNSVGLEKDSIKIELIGNYLNISGKSEELGFEKQIKEKFALDYSINTNLIESNLKNGILIINLPFKEKLKKEIKIF